MYKFKIDKRNPLFFVHIPKTAGTSMRMFLADQYANQPICPAVDWAGLLNIAPENISGFDLIQGHFGVNLKPLIRPDAKTLVLLRNPLNRTLSALRHLKRDPNFHALHEHVKDMSVGEILSDPALFEMQSNVQTALLSARSNPNSILRYLRDGPPLKDHQPDPADLEEVVADLDIAKQNLEQIDFIGICESLDEFLPGFCRAMGYHPLQSFRRDNGAPDGLSDFAALAADEIELLKACNKLDLELYDYAVKLAASRRAESEVTYSTLSDAVLGLRDAGTYATCDQTFEVDLAGPIPGSGWYEPELADDRTFRWTGPAPEFSLELPLAAGAHFRVTMRFSSPLPLRATDFRVTANRLWLPVELRGGEAGSGGFEVIFDIPQFITARDRGFCQLVFELPSIYRPSEHRAPDLRGLGVAVTVVEFERLD